MTAEANGDTQAAGERLLTADELAQMPGDGDRYELLDGELMISPRPSPLHQVVAARLSGMLASSCPEGMSVLPGPAIRLSRSTILTGDVTVIRRRPPGGGPLTEPPLLVAELRAAGPAAAATDRPIALGTGAARGAPSPATSDGRAVDRRAASADRRAAAYALFGVWSYWVLVVNVRWPELTVFEVADGRYERVGRAVGGEVLRVRQPFFAEVIPARLTAGLLPADRPRDTIGVTA